MRNMYIHTEIIMPKCTNLHRNASKCAGQVAKTGAIEREIHAILKKNPLRTHTNVHPERTNMLPGLIHFHGTHAIRRVPPR